MIKIKRTVGFCLKVFDTLKLYENEKLIIPFHFACFLFTLNQSIKKIINYFEKELELNPNYKTFILEIQKLKIDDEKNKTELIEKYKKDIDKMLPILEKEFFVKSKILKSEDIPKNFPGLLFLINAFPEVFEDIADFDSSLEPIT